MTQLNRTRAERAVNLERWADLVKPEDLTDADPEDSRQILELLTERAEPEEFVSDTPDTFDPQRRDSTKSSGY